MGDRTRNEVLARWVADHHPGAKVADVAGGQGLLTLELLARGLTSTVIDPRITDLSADLRRRQRRGELPMVTRRRRLFSAADAGEFDLVVSASPRRRTWSGRTTTATSSTD